MRVLVTGAAGFVGRAVVHRLIEVGNEVAIMTRRPPREEPANARSLIADVLDAPAITRAIDEWEPDGVCHLAGLTRVRDSFRDPVGYFAVNVTGTLHVLGALAQLGDRTGRVPRLVFASSVAVYGVRGGEAIPEDVPTLPTTPYGASKLAADNAIGYQAATGALAAASLRCFNVAGATPETWDSDLTRALPKALAVAAGTEPYLTMNGDGSSTRDYLHVSDLADAYAIALAAAEPGRHRIYNTGSALPVSLRDVIASVERVTGRQLAIRRGPAQNEPPALLADNSRIRRDLAWEPRRSQLDGMVQDAWEAVAVALSRT